MKNILVIAGRQLAICLGFFPRLNWAEITEQNLAQKLNQDLFCSISNTLNWKLQNNFDYFSLDPSCKWIWFFNDEE